MNTRQSSPLLTEAQAAERLCLSVRTLQSWRLRGGGPRFVKLGAAVRYSAETLDEFIVSGTVASTSQEVA